MARPKAGYRTADGTRVPGTTTITGRFKDAGGLIQWAYQCGVDGIDLNDARDAAAGAGTICHEMIEDYIHGRPWELRPGQDTALVEPARKGFANFLTWAKSAELEVVATEISLVSEEHRFGGTLDAIAHVGGALVVLDWKTSKGTRVYPEMVLQLAAYRQLWAECRGEQPTAAHMVRISREHGQAVHYLWDVAALDLAWNYFAHLRAAYDLDKQLKGMVG